MKLTMKYLVELLLDIMKYLLKHLFYLVMWAILVPYLIAERAVKTASILILILWHIEYKALWLDRLKTYYFLFFIPPFPMVLEWRINCLTDYFMLKKWELL